MRSGRASSSALSCLCALAGASLWRLAVPAFLTLGTAPVLPPRVAVPQQGSAAPVAPPTLPAATGSPSGIAAASLALAAAALVGSAATRVQRRSGLVPRGAKAATWRWDGEPTERDGDYEKKKLRHALPQQIPVLDMEGNQIGEETLKLKVLSRETANYVVHHTLNTYNYMNVREFTAYMKRRSEVRKGPKPWQQKGSGKARHGSRYSPLFGKSSTNKAPHGLDNKRKKKIGRHQHAVAISTVLQSKWRNMKIIEGLEDWKEPRQNKLYECLRAWGAERIGKKDTLIVSRSGYGAMHKRLCVPTTESYDSPLYMSGRLIDKLTFRRPRDIDPEFDGLPVCLKARQLYISREAFFDLKAKYGSNTVDPDDGWIFKGERDILVESMQRLMKEYPMDRAAEIAAARTMPRSIAEREFWARDERIKLGLEEAPASEFEAKMAKRGPFGRPVRTSAGDVVF